MMCNKNNSFCHSIENESKWVTIKWNQSEIVPFSTILVYYIHMQSSMANQLTHLRASNLNSTFHLSCNDRQVSIYCDLPEGWSLPILFCNQIDTCLSMWQKYSVLEIGIVQVLTYLLCRYIPPSLRLGMVL